jgi:hypothetical protein
MRALQWIGVLLGCCLLARVAQAGCVMVYIVGGDDLFEQSAWVQKNLAEGTSGWLIGAPPTEPYLLESWQPDNIWDEPGKTPKAKTIHIVHDPSFAYGIRTGFGVRDLGLGTKKQGWQVVFLRDVERARRYEPLCISERAAILVKRGWAQVDSILESISRELNSQNDLLIITVVPVQGTDLLVSRLSPVFIAGHSVGKGLLQDDSTRMSGFGQRVSLIPTVRHHLRLSLTSTRQGSILKGNGEIPSVAKLAAMRSERLQRAEARRVGTWLPWMWVLLVAAGAWVFEKRKQPLSPPKPAEATQPGVISREMLLQKRPRPGLAPSAPEPPSPSEPRRRIHPALFALWGVALTLSSFFPAVFSPHGWVLALAVMIAGAGILAWCTRFLDSPLLGAGVMCGLGLVMLLLDSFSGGHWSRDGMLAYNPLLDNRYFGVGNGYAALAMAWALFFLACWLQIQGLLLTGVFLLGILTMWLGWKSANFGATSAALGTTIIYAGLLFYPKIKPGQVKWWTWMGAALLITLSGWLLWRGTPHLQAFLQEPSAQVLWRKLQMNWEQILFSRWGLLLGVSLWAAWRVRKHLFIDPQMKMLERTWLTAGTLMLLLNDSGVLMAACLACLYWSWLCLHYWQEVGLHEKLSHA